MIELKNVYLGYNKEYYALFDISLKIENGERIALVGEQGSGKTAFLRLIAGLDKQQKGEIYIDNTPVQKVDFAHDVSLGYLSSKAIFFENRTVYKNLAWALKIRGVDKKLWEKQIMQVLTDFGITQLKEARVGTLCRSDRRLVQIARLALRPLDILLCDDIEMNTDSKTFGKLNEAIKKLIDKDKKDKIVIITCNSAKGCKDLVDRRVKIVSGSLETEEVKKEETKKEEVKKD